MSREDIERDAAAQLGLHTGTRRTTPPPEAPEEELSEAYERGGGNEVDEPAVAGAGRRLRRPGRASGWLRDFVDNESPTARRERLEREAAAELGLSDRSEPPVD